MTAMAYAAEDEVDLALLKAENPDAQKAFWLAHWERTYAICARILGHGADAADVATDVIDDFLFRYVGGLSHQRAIRSYVRLMATRRSLRRRKQRDRQDELGGDELGAEPSRTAEDMAGVALLRPQLGRCLEQLTPKAQQVLNLRFGSEMTNERIGQLVGGSKQYIGRLIRQSTEKLRECLDQ